MRRRVLMVQPSLQPPGGGNGVAAWVLEALQDHHDLGVLTWTPVDLDSVNQFYGTALRRSCLHVTTMAGFTRWSLDSVPLPAALLKHALLIRAARKLACAWDVLLTVNNEADFGRPGIQYVHYPAYRRPRPKDDVRWYHGPPLVLDAYYALADRIADISFDRVRQNLTLVNSDWTGRLVRDRHGIVPLTVYPPVHGHFRQVPWEERAEGFLCVGRISPEKQLHTVIDILSLVRRSRPGISLRIVGTLSRNRYCRDIEKRVEAEAGWVSIDGNLSRHQLLDLIPRYRYGIHGMPEEHFGMAPAEMVSAGCIVFVPRGGGQVEVVGHEPRLTYSSVEGAAEAIVHVIEHPEEQTEIRRRLAERKPLFSGERFARTIRELVDAFPAPIPSHP